MEQLKMMKEQLMAKVQCEMGHLDTVDAEELGEVVDMIKDLAEAMKFCEEEKYYKKVTEAMEKKDGEEKHIHYYTPKEFFHPPYDEYYPERDMDRHMGRMYYGGQGRDSQGRFTSGESGSSNGSSNNSGSSDRGTGGRSYYGGDTWEREFPIEMRDQREGKSPLSRKMYMESKEMHKDKATKIKDLENYLKELSEDIVEMIQDASPEERAVMTNKVTSLANKISSMPVNG